MKDTILYKLLKWILASSVSLLALPISLFIFIFSLYPDLTDDFDFTKLKNFYVLSDINDNGIKVSKIQLDTFDTKKYNHYLFIDATKSTKISDKDKINFKKSLNDYLTDTTKINRKSFYVTLSPNDSIKKYLYFTLIKNYAISNNWDTLFIYVYKGETHYTKLNLLKLPLDSINDVKYKAKYSQITQSANNQKTNFKNILDSIIPVLIKTKTNNILTIFSDFYHDDTIITPKVFYQDFDYFKDRTKIEKYNLIALWSYEHSVKRKIAQNELIRDFQIHLDGVINTDYVFVDRYNDDNYYNRGTTTNNLELLALFKVNNTDIKKIKEPGVTFSSSISNEFNYEEGNAKIVLHEKYKNPHFYWRIKEIFNSENHFTKYRKFENDKEATYFLNVIDDVNEHPFFYYINNVGKKARYFYRPFFENSSDTLLLALRIDGTFVYDKYELAVCSIDDSSFYYKEFNIDLKKNIIVPERKNFLRYTLNVFCFLIILFLIAGYWLFILLFNDYKKQLFQYSLSRLLRLAIEILVLIALLILLGWFFISAKGFLWPGLILLIIALMIIGKINCLRKLKPHIQRKWKIFSIQKKQQIITRINNQKVLRRRKQYARKERRKWIINNIKGKLYTLSRFFKYKISIWINKIKEKIQNLILNIKSIFVKK